MSQKLLAVNFLDNVNETIRILYWVYWKPFTLKKWLTAIHPNLKSFDNPFLKQNYFANNPRLRHYAWQIWWLNIISMQVLLVVLLFQLYVNGDFFRNINLILFWISSWVGIGFISRFVHNLQRYKLSLALFFIVLIVPRILFSVKGIPSLREFLDFIINFISLSPIFGISLVIVIAEVAVVIWGIGLGVFLSVCSSQMSSIGLVGAVTSITSSIAFITSSLIDVETLKPGEFYIFSTTSKSLTFAFIGAALGMTLTGFYFLESKKKSFILVTFIFLGITFGILFSTAESWIGGLIISTTSILGILRVYCWFPEFLWMLLLFLISRYGKAVSLLNYLPPRFDELIILPLPFMAELIVEAYHENPAAARNIIDYLVSSTNQQNVAAQAVTGIAIDFLNHCQTTGDIIAVSEQLAWIPSPPPREMSTVLPKFLAISQDVRASQETTSAYRQCELLDSPIRMLQELGDFLAYSQNAHFATSFGSIVQRWLKILQTAQQTLAEQAKRSAEIPQVYIAGASLNPDDSKTRFKGRQDIFREIETLALSTQPPILLLHGGRRTGKTSTLKYLPRKVGSELIPLLIDLQGAATATTLKGLANYLAEEIVKAAKKSRNFDLPYPNSQQLNQEPFLTLQTWLEKLERIAPGKRFLLCLDEFERLSEVIATTNSRVPLNFLRHVLQHRRQWILLFSGSHTLDELEPYWSDYLINTRSLRVSYLQKPEAEELIVQPIADFPKIYESLTVSQIIQATRCQPYLVQLLCTVIVDHLNREKRRLATPDDVQTCIPIAIETGGMYFRELWTSLSEPEQDFLESLITEETPHPQNKSTVRRLIRKEILEKTGDCYQFQVPLVETFITQVVTEE